MSEINKDIVTRVDWQPEFDKSGLMKSFEEMICGPVDSIHIERMSDDTIWMAFYKGDDRQVVVISSLTHKAKIVARTEEQ